MTQRCTLTELPTDQCAHCLGHADPLPATVGYPLKARIGGRCSGCGEPFEPNAMIYADGQGGYLADCCWDQT